MEGHQVQALDDKSYFYPWLKNSDSRELLDFTLIQHKMICECSANGEYNISANSQKHFKMVLKLTCTSESSGKFVKTLLGPTSKVS